MSKTGKENLPQPNYDRPPGHHSFPSPCHTLSAISNLKNNSWLQTATCNCSDTNIEEKLHFINVVVLDH